MKVEATRLGYYGLLRKRPGDVFELEPMRVKGADGKITIISPEQQFSKAWMKDVSDAKPRAAKSAPAPVKASSFNEDVI